ncbi:hypothetical protein PInf_004539 [Phytophthora infestans]|nr:hypothetical protein PInf_004539 [Phytophthora infestans]
MVEREVFSDEEEERVFDRSPEGGVDEQLVPVPVAVERLERGARVRVSEDPRKVWRSPLIEVTEVRSCEDSVTDVLRGLYADEFKETEEGARGRTEADVGIKTEVKEDPEMKREVVAARAYTTDGYDSEYYDAQEAYDSEYDAEYKQDEIMKSAQKTKWVHFPREDNGVRGLRGGYGPGMAAKIPVPKGTADPFQLSQLVSNAMKVLPVFYSDTATVEKARGLWELFEVHTEGLPDRSRLLVLRQRLKGQEAERWWGNSSIRTLSMRKDRFHNQFLRRTADEVWDRLEATRREKGESVEEWGDFVSDLCESSDYPNPQMRCQLLYRGLRNKRMLETLDASLPPIFLKRVSS